MGLPHYVLVIYGCKVLAQCKTSQKYCRLLLLVVFNILHLFIVHILLRRAIVTFFQESYIDNMKGECQEVWRNEAFVQNHPVNNQNREIKLYPSLGHKV